MTDQNHDPITCAACGAVNPWMNEACRVCGASFDGEAARPVSRRQADADEPLAGAENTSTEGQAATAEKAPSDGEPTAADANASDEQMSQDPLDSPIWSLDARRRARRAPATFRAHAWNPLWILLGVVLFLALFVAGQYLIMRFVIATDPELKQMVEQFNARQAEALRAGENAPEKVISEAEAQELRAALFGNGLLVATGVLVLLLPPLLVGGLLMRKTGALRNGAVASAVGATVMMLLSQQLLIAVVFGLLYGGLGMLGGLAVRKLFSRFVRQSDPS